MCRLGEMRQGELSLQDQTGPRAQRGRPRTHCLTRKRRTRRRGRARCGDENGDGCARRLEIARDRRHHQQQADERRASERTGKQRASESELVRDVNEDRTQLPRPKQRVWGGEAMPLCQSVGVDAQASTILVQGQSTACGSLFAAGNQACGTYSGTFWLTSSPSGSGILDTCENQARAFNPIIEREIVIISNPHDPSSCTFCPALLSRTFVYSALLCLLAHSL